MTAGRERSIIRVLHLVLSIPIVGFIYGPVASIPQAAWFTRWVAMPVVVLSGLWLWLKPKVMARLQEARHFEMRAQLRSVQRGKNATVQRGV